MMSDLVLQSGVAALSSKLVLAGWVAIVILIWVDGRKSATGFVIGLAGLTLALSLRGALRSGPGMVLAPVCWWISCGLSLCIGLQQLGRWAKATPKELHDESAIQGTSRASKHRGTKPKHTTTSTTASPWNLARRLLAAACVIGLLATTLALLSDSSMLLVSRQTWWLSATHLLASTTLLGIMLVCGLQLSILSAPDLLGPQQVHTVNWRLLSRIALVMAVAEAALCASIFWRGIPDFPEAVEAATLEKLFGLTLLIVSFTAWMIPHRLATFQATGNVKGWTALALSAWIMVLVFALIVALPTIWPWESAVA